MRLLVEQSGEEASAKDGGFVFQAIISHKVKWEIVNGETRIDPKKILATLHQVDVFPDMKFTEGSATLTYVILSEVNLLKRKFELASEAIKKRIKPEYGQAIEQLGKEGSESKKSELNAAYFNRTYYEATLSTDRVVLREVSASGIDSGRAKITLKISTGMVDTLNAQPVKSWDGFRVDVDGSASMQITNQNEPISGIKEYDQIEKIDDVVFQTIVPSLILEFKGDRVDVDNYSNRSSQAAAYALIDYDKLFVVEEEGKKKEESTGTKNK
jgi:hypothetical protein